MKFQIFRFDVQIRTSDEELIEQVNEAAKLEGERQEKRKRHTTGKS